MRIDRRLTIIGIMLIVLSMTMATQYATTRVGYEYNIVHPSDADIRFIGSDNSSDNITILRVSGANSTTASLKLTLGGNFSAYMNKTYTAAFGIVNEEIFNVNITHINVTSTTEDYLRISLHKNRTTRASEDSGSVLMWANDALVSSATSCAWQLGPGNQNAANMNGTKAWTNWTGDSHVRASKYNGEAINGTSDFVWVEICVDLPASPDQGGDHSGVIYIHFEASEY